MEPNKFIMGVLGRNQFDWTWWSVENIVMETPGKAVERHTRGFSIEIQET